MKVINLKTEYRTNPLGIETPHPRLSWQLLSSEKGVLQTAFRIQCASSVEDLNKEMHLLWDTNRVVSDQSIHVEYMGQELISGQRIYWHVRVWDNKGHVYPWSEPAFFEMGLLNTSDWKAKWIEPDIYEDPKISNPCPYVRKEFTLKQNIKDALLYITAHGLYEASINGARVGNELFTPGWTSYHKRLQYQVFDVTSHLQVGQNAIGVILGDGWYRGFLGWQGEKNLYGEKTALLIQLKILYRDDSEELIISDNTWKSTTGPIVQSDIYNGEHYDARLEIDARNKPGFDDSKWNGTIEKDHPKDILIASEGPPVRITETIKPIKKIQTPRGEAVFDLGQNIVGWVQIKLKGEQGSKITLNHAEALDKDGNFYTDNLRAAKAEDQYIFKGEGIETWEPHFTFHGFRYIKVSDYKGKITPGDIKGRVIHSDMTPSGHFECSDPLINRLQKNIQWGLRGNFLDVPTDCPQRDERLGWTGDAQVFAPTACFNMDTAGFYTKWMKDFIADRREDGSMPWVVPMVVKDGGGTGWSDGYGATGWADAAVIIPWVVYQAYGDKKILETQYKSMKAWVEYMLKHAGDRYIFDHGFHFGDWLSFAEYYSYYYNAPDYGYAGAHTDKDFIATAYFYYSTVLIQKTAAILGKKEDADKYNELLPKIKAAFQKEFMTKNGRLTSNTQTAYSLALSFDLLPEDLKKTAAQRLAQDVKHFGHLTTGFLGTPLLCDALTENGYPDVAYRLLFNTKYPSWLYPVTEGATTIWERWDGIKPDGTFQTAGMNSFNHYAYGAIGHWLYTKVAGLSADPEMPGYKRSIIKPFITDQLSYAKAEYHSIYGIIKSHWKREKGKLRMYIEIPANTTAQIHIPTEKIDNIANYNETGEIKYLGIEEDRVILEIGSGSYDFIVKNYKMF